MRRTTFAVALIIASISAIEVASAQDILRAMYSSRPIAIWNGFYVGANVGYGSNYVESTSTIQTGTIAQPTSNVRMKGVLAGGQAGYNYQTGNYVLGLETDFQWSSQDERRITTAAGVTFTDDTKANWFGTTRARFGYAADYMLFYVTGGGAYGEFNRSTQLSGAATGLLANSTTQFGWAFGGGIEGMITRNWSWRAEYLRVQFAKFNQDFNVVQGGIVVGTYTLDTRLTNDIVRLGLNYYFR